MTGRVSTLVYHRDQSKERAVGVLHLHVIDRSGAANKEVGTPRPPPTPLSVSTLHSPVILQLTLVNRSEKDTATMKQAVCPQAACPLSHSARSWCLSSQAQGHKTGDTHLKKEKNPEIMLFAFSITPNIKYLYVRKMQGGGIPELGTGNGESTV